MEPTLDQVREELADIHEELFRLPAEDFARRVELKSRQQELRQTSARLVDSSPVHDATVVKAAHVRLREVRDRLIEERLGASSPGDSAWGGFALALDQAINAGVAKTEIEERLEEILEQLRASD